MGFKEIPIGILNNQWDDSVKYIALSTAVEPEIPEEKLMFFILSDDMTPLCNYSNKHGMNSRMDKHVFSKGIEFCHKNNYLPVISDIGHCNSASIECRALNNNYTLSISRYNIERVFTSVRDLNSGESRINIIIGDLDTWDDEQVQAYRKQLYMLCNLIIDSYAQSSLLEINVLTDILNLTGIGGCIFGERAFALAPNARIYICPAFYFDNPDDSVGDLEKGIYAENKGARDLNKVSFCSICYAFHCKRCKYLNNKLTNDINTPSKIQCLVSHAEREAAKYLQREFIKRGFTYMGNSLKDIKLKSN